MVSEQLKDSQVFTRFLFRISSQLWEGSVGTLHYAYRFTSVHRVEFVSVAATSKVSELLAPSDVVVEVKIFSGLASLTIGASEACIESMIAHSILKIN